MAVAFVVSGTVPGKWTLWLMYPNDEWHVQEMVWSRSVFRYNRIKFQAYVFPAYQSILLGW